MTSENASFIKRLLIICAVITLIIILVIGVSYIIDILMLAFAAVLIAVAVLALVLTVAFGPLGFVIGLVLFALMFAGAMIVTGGRW